MCKFTSTICNSYILQTCQQLLISNKQYYKHVILQYSTLISGIQFFKVCITVNFNQLHVTNRARRAEVRQQKCLAQRNLCLKVRSATDRRKKNPNAKTNRFTQLRKITEDILECRGKCVIVQHISNDFRLGNNHFYLFIDKQVNMQYIVLY